jgi:hypothetical protein
MNPEHLLEQAESLAGRGVGRPRQADLRRAVSTAYYALFHLLTQHGSRRVTATGALQPVIARAFNHGDMKQVSQLFARGQVPGSLAGLAPSIPIPPDLMDVAQAFIELQQARHTADYNLTRGSTFTRSTARAWVRQARDAIAAWDRVRTDPAAEVYLIAMLLHQKLGR